MNVLSVLSVQSRWLTSARTAEGNSSSAREGKSNDEAVRAGAWLVTAPPHGTIHAPTFHKMVYHHFMSRTNIDIDETLIRKARQITRLKTKREIVDKALELLVRSETRKGILRYYGSGIWKGDLKTTRRNRV